MMLSNLLQSSPRPADGNLSRQKGVENQQQQEQEDEQEEVGQSHQAAAIGGAAAATGSVDDDVTSPKLATSSSDSPSAAIPPTPATTIPNRVKDWFFESSENENNKDDRHADFGLHSIQDLDRLNGLPTSSLPSTINNNNNNNSRSDQHSGSFKSENYEVELPSEVLKSVVWAGIIRNDQMLVAVPSHDQLSPAVAANARDLLNKLPVIGWDAVTNYSQDPQNRFSFRRRGYRGIRFHLYHDNDPDNSPDTQTSKDHTDSKHKKTPITLWIFACVYNTQHMNEREAKDFVEQEMVEMTKLQRLHDPVWKHSPRYLACQAKFAPILHDLMRDATHLAGRSGRTSARRGGGAVSYSSDHHKIAQQIIQNNQKVIAKYGKQKVFGRFLLLQHQNRYLLDDGSDSKARGTNNDGGSSLMEIDSYVSSLMENKASDDTGKPDEEGKSNNKEADPLTNADAGLVPETKKVYPWRKQKQQEKQLESGMVSNDENRDTVQFDDVGSTPHQTVHPWDKAGSFSMPTVHEETTKFADAETTPTTAATTPTQTSPFSDQDTEAPNVGSSPSSYGEIVGEDGVGKENLPLRKKERDNRPWATPKAKKRTKQSDIEDGHVSVDPQELNDGDDLAVALAAIESFNEVEHKIRPDKEKTIDTSGMNKEFIEEEEKEETGPPIHVIVTSMESDAKKEKKRKSKKKSKKHGRSKPKVNGLEMILKASQVLKKMTDEEKEEFRRGNRIEKDDPTLIEFYQMETDADLVPVRPMVHQLLHEFTVMSTIRRLDGVNSVPPDFRPRTSRSKDHQNSGPISVGPSALVRTQSVHTELGTQRRTSTTTKDAIDQLAVRVNRLKAVEDAGHTSAAIRDAINHDASPLSVRDLDMRMSE